MVELVLLGGESLVLGAQRVEVVLQVRRVALERRDHLAAPRHHRPPLPRAHHVLFDLEPSGRERDKN